MLWGQPLIFSFFSCFGRSSDFSLRRASHPGHEDGRLDAGRRRIEVNLVLAAAATRSRPARYRGKEAVRFESRGFGGPLQREVRLS